MELLPLQPGDVLDTFADVSDLVKDFDYKPSITIKEGVAKFIEWYKNYYSAQVLITSFDCFIESIINFAFELDSLIK